MAIGTSSIYPTVESILNRARVLVNDAYQNGAGRVLTDIAPFTLQYFNMAVNRVQFKLANHGVPSSWRDNLILGPIQAIATSDPGNVIYITYQGSDFGAGNVPQPALPNDLIIPWDVWERPAGSSQNFVLMKHVQKLPSRIQSACCREYIWEGDALKSCGATQDTEWRLRYESVIPEISPLPAGTTAAQAQVIYNAITVPIRMGAEAIAQRIAYFYEDARGDDAEGLARRDSNAETEVDKLVEANARATQRQSVRRRGFSQRGVNL
jgi:hypothetical protein